MTLAPKTPLKRKFSHDQSNKPFIETGAEVTCPNRMCQAHIAFFVKPIYPTQRLTSAHLLGPTIRHGMEMKCWRCNMPWFLAETSQIHLRSGWLPRY